jgi:BlaI family penicillinase repressor
LGRKRSLHGLGSLQSEVMELVWNLGEATVAQVHEQISKRRPVRYTTVLVAMQKLEKKKWLTHRSAGRAYLYEPLRSRDAAHASVLRELVRSAFGGDPRLLLSQLLQTHPMNEAELSELRKLIDARRRELRGE